MNPMQLLDEMTRLVLAMLKAEASCGSSYYSDDAWITAYDELSSLVGVDMQGEREEVLARIAALEAEDA